MASTHSTSSDSSPIHSLKFAVGTDIGRRREENQDSFGIVEAEDLRFFIVADGMGGAKGGATASSMAIEVVRQALASKAQVGIDDIISAVTRANSEIFEKGSQDETLSGMGTTFVGLAFKGAEMIVTNVGDSRAYRIRAGKIRQLTEDHTLVKELLRSGAISAEQADHHPVAHMLTRSLGPTPDVMVDCAFSSSVPCRGDRYLLCSDGLYNLVQDSEIASIVELNSLDDAVEKIVNLSNERGGTDNITVIIVEVGDAYPEVSDTDESLNDIFELSAELSEEQGDYNISAHNQSAVHDNRIDPSESHRNSKHSDRQDREYTENGVGQESENSISGKERSVRRLRPEADSTENNIREERATRPAIVERAIRDQQARTSVSAWSRTAIFGVLMALVGGLAVSFFSTGVRTGTLSDSDQMVVNPLASYLARSPVLLSSRDNRPEQILPRLVDSIRSQNSSLNQSGEYNVRDQVDVVIDDAVGARKKVLESYLIELNTKIAALGKPLTGELAERFKKAQSEVGAIERSIVAARDELDRSTRKLSVWFGRKQRLDNTDPVDMASEVSVSSTSVKEKKELFERATWAYLKEVEIWRFSPSDEALTRRVSELGRVREQRRRELASEVRQAVERSVADSEQEISALTLKRDRFQSEFDALNREIKFFKLVTTGSQAAKAERVKELEQEKKAVSSELEELIKHLSEIS